MLAFRLCLALGELHPDILLAKLTHSQWMEWVAYAKLEPFGEDRADLRNAILCDLTARANGSKSSKIEQYMPFRRKSTDSDILSYFLKHHPPESKP